MGEGNAVKRLISHPHIKITVLMTTTTTTTTTTETKRYSIFFLLVVPISPNRRNKLYFHTFKVKYNYHKYNSEFETNGSLPFLKYSGLLPTAVSPI